MRRIHLVHINFFLQTNYNVFQFMMLRTWFWKASRPRPVHLV